MLKRLSAWLFPMEAVVAPPAVRMILGSAIQTTRRRVVGHIVVAALYVGGALLLGYQLIYPITPLESRTVGFHISLMMAALFGQFLVSASAFGMSMTFIHRERLNGTWDIIRTTAGGTRQAIRAAWVSMIFYRLSGWLGVLVYAPRLFMFGVFLIDLMVYRGEYLSYIVGGALPDISLWVGVPLLALTVTSAFLLPITGVGVEVAVGLLCSTVFRSKFFTGFFQIGLTIVRVAYGVLASLWIASITFYNPLLTFPQPDGSEWVGLSLSAAVGDWGFSLISAPTLDRLWRSLPYIAFLGIALVAMMGVQMLITEGLLRWTARRAQKME